MPLPFIAGQRILVTYPGALESFVGTVAFVRPRKVLLNFGGGEYHRYIIPPGPSWCKVWRNEAGRQCYLIAADESTISPEPETLQAMGAH